jgi:hypothetical protein
LNGLRAGLPKIDLHPWSVARRLGGQRMSTASRPKGNWKPLGALCREANRLLRFLATANGCNTRCAAREAAETEANPVKRSVPPRLLLFPSFIPFYFPAIGVNTLTEIESKEE